MAHPNHSVESRPTNLLHGVLRQVGLLWATPLAAGLLTAVFFTDLMTLAGPPWLPSDTNYYSYLADAFLHGQLHLRLMPINTHDLSFYNNQYFLYWGPLPAVLFMPFVALFGVGFSDTFQTLVIGSINVGLFALLLRQANRRELIDLQPWQRALLVFFFAFGTAHTPLLAVGTVWHVAQLAALCFILLAFLAAFSLEGGPAFFWTGCGVAAVLATRMSAALVAVFLVGYLLARSWKAGPVQLFRYCLLGIAPVAVTGLLLMAYNFARFGDPLENGLTYHLMSEYFRPMFTRYGALNVHFIPINLYYNLVYYPLVSLDPIQVMPHGGSLFLLSPLFFAALTALWSRRKEWVAWGLFAAFLFGSLPSLMIMAPGSFNFGPRYLLDAAPPLLLLTAMGIRRWPAWLAVLFTVIAVLHYVAGAMIMIYAWY